MCATGESDTFQALSSGKTRHKCYFKRSSPNTTVGYEGHKIRVFIGYSMTSITAGKSRFE